jgi:fatty-acyl-CoA synthase
VTLTLDRWIRERARVTPDRTAIVFGERLVTYRELDECSDARAAALAARGLERGDRLATLTGNSPEHVEVFFACAKLGLILLPLNRRLAPAELEYQLVDAGPALLLVEDGLEVPATEVPVEPLAAAPPGAGSPPALVEDGDPLLLIYTSGTTGRPKGALLTHANCFWTNLSLDLVLGLTGDDVVLQTLPQFHVGGWNVQPLLAWWRGATVVLERAFEPERVLRLIAERRITAMMGVPSTYLFLAQQPGFERADLSSLRLAVVGGAPMPEALLETWRSRGVAIVQGYGLTEAAPNVLGLAPEDAVRKAGWAGRPYPYVEARLGEGDELLVRGPNVFAGYWRNPEASAAAFVEGGWLRTGDAAEQDGEGFFRIRGRLKDMFISGGENVYPAEIAAVLHEHPAVADAAVIGVPDERWGETGVAFVVGSATEGELLELCRGRLAGYKVPRSIVFVEALPRSGSGKVLKEALREGVGV